MIGIRIICHFCGKDCFCPVPIGDLKTNPLKYECENCKAHLVDFQDIEVEPK